MGVLTYAKFEENVPCILKIPNNVVKNQFFQNIKNRINMNHQDEIIGSLNILYRTRNISQLVENIELFFRENVRSTDIAQSKEDNLDWCLFFILKPFLQNQIERQKVLAIIQNNTKVSKFIDLIITPENYQKFVFLIEEKNIPFIKMTAGLKEVYRKKNRIEILHEFDQKDWGKLEITYNKIFYQEKNYELSEQELLSVKYEYFDSQQQKNILTTIESTIIEAKKQLLKYKNLLKKQEKYQNKQIFNYVILRCGPSKLYGFGESSS